MLLNKNKQCLLNRRTSGPGSLPPCMPALPWTELWGIRWNDCRWKPCSLHHSTHIHLGVDWETQLVKTKIPSILLFYWVLGRLGLDRSKLHLWWAQRSWGEVFSHFLFLLKHIIPQKKVNFGHINFRFQSLVKVNARRMWRSMDPTLLRECSAQAAPTRQAAAR